VKTAGLLFLWCLLASCQRRPSLPEGPNARAFYYWRTTFSLSDRERAALDELQIKKLYVRLFDVDRDGQQVAPATKGPLVVPPQKRSLPKSLELVPVVFIREAALRSLDEAAIRMLSTQVWNEAQRRFAPFESPARELQFDCDWTDATRDVFFGLLEHIKPMAMNQGIALSSTIRLHQIKYRERTGVPPVSRGMLMFYNMGSIDAESGTQAIFDVEIASKYLARLHDYPLPLDVALPMWSWVVHVRGDKVVGLMQNTAGESLRSKKQPSWQPSANLVACLTPTQARSSMSCPFRKRGSPS
jgi:hypothetical protein